MAKNGKPSENKVKVPKATGKVSAKSKDRKGHKSRKLGPSRRLAQSLAKFTGVSGELTQHKNMELAHVQKYVRNGDMQPLSGAELDERINRPRHKTLNPLKIARLLMPNGY